MGASVPTTVVLDVSTLAPSVLTIDALARFQLAARRRGQRLQLCQASDELRQLIAYTGLSEVLRVETRGQSEERE
jgi:anti-anti-sigma regulatory factor